MWTSLIISLPSESSALRMRIWRTLKASGVATLRDGVYLAPANTGIRPTFDEIASDVSTAGGTALIANIEEPEGGNFPALFDRSDDYAPLLKELGSIAGVSDENVVGRDQQKQIRKIRKNFDALCAIDFFPGPAKQQVEAALNAIEQRVIRLLSPDEPNSVSGGVPRVSPEEFRNRTWATRKRPWIDRLACAWLIRRFVDPQARFLWLENPQQIPANAIGFDFDGATFSHVGAYVTFETLVASFDITVSGIHRMAAIVHFLDVGGIQPPEAAGIESVMAGLRDSITDDDSLLTVAFQILDGLLVSLQKEPSNG